MAKPMRKKRPAPASRFKGLAWDKHEGCWRVRVSLFGKQHHLGRHTDENFAAQVYDCAAFMLFGENGAVNFGGDRAKQWLPRLLAEDCPGLRAVRELGHRCRALSPATAELAAAAAAAPAAAAGGAGSGSSAGGAGGSGSPLAGAGGRGGSHDDDAADDTGRSRDDDGTRAAVAVTAPAAAAAALPAPEGVSGTDSTPVRCAAKRPRSAAAAGPAHTPPQTGYKLGAGHHSLIGGALQPFFSSPAGASVSSSSSAATMASPPPATPGLAKASGGPVLAQPLAQLLATAHAAADASASAATCTSPLTSLPPGALDAPAPLAMLSPRAVGLLALPAVAAAAADTARPRIRIDAAAPGGQAAANRPPAPSGMVPVTEGGRAPGALRGNARGGSLWGTRAPVAAVPARLPMPPPQPQPQPPRMEIEPPAMTAATSAAAATAPPPLSTRAAAVAAAAAAAVAATALDEWGTPRVQLTGALADLAELGGGGSGYDLCGSGAGSGAGSAGPAALDILCSPRWGAAW